MTDPTPKQLAMARRIYADYMRRTLTSRGEEYDDALIREVTDGLHDDKHGVQIALAALIETSERAAKLADKLNGVGSPKRSYVGDALRNGYHIPGEKS